MSDVAAPSNEVPKKLTPKSLTPMMQQYMAAKAKVPDAIVLFRLGDFYEMFFEDARLASRLLGLTLTSRDKDKDKEDAVPMAGVPHHAVQGYVARLCDEGYKVALCEQVEEPGKKGMFRREVSRVVTPGMVFDEESLDRRAENLLAGLYGGERGYGLCTLDVSTGRFRVTETGDGSLAGDELLRLSPRELVVSTTGEALDPFLARLRRTRVTPVELPPGPQTPAAIATELCLAALAQALPDKPRHLGEPERYELDEFVLIDETSRRNLELTQTMIGGKREGSLLHHLDRCQTGMGSRLLAYWLTSPACSLAKIRERQEAVGHWLAHPALRAQVAELLRAMYDLERLNGRLGALQATPRDLGALRDTLALLPRVGAALSASFSGALSPQQQVGLPGQVPARLAHLLAELGDFAAVRARLGEALVDTPPVTFKEGGIFRSGYDPEIDELAQLSASGKDYLLAMEQRERERTKISSLKIRYNRVFGYGIEITKSHLERVPADYVRKQTLANAERYVTEELRSYEEKVLHADEKRLALEEMRFVALRASLLDACGPLRRAAQAIAELDALLSLALVSADGDYVQPELCSASEIELVGARHPVVEAFVRSLGQAYVPCDVRLGDDARLLVVTGPNMAGKSTVLREVAIIQIMAQMGCYVPARRARLGLADRIFTRVGASDNLSQGQSTFMVEMSETAAILRGATARSLVIVDEIGRGTSTFDGLSLAWAVAEHLHDVVQCRGLFATHYHELVELAVECPRVRNFHMAVREWNGQVVFLRELRPGGTSRSYGIEVARLAGLPQAVIARAKELLAELDADRGSKQLGQSSRPEPAQMSLFVPVSDRSSSVLQKLRAVDVDQLTPLEALNTLASLVRESKQPT